MKPEHLITFATALALTWSVGAVLNVLRPARPQFWLAPLYAAASFLALAAVLWASSISSLGRNSVVFLLQMLQEASPNHLCAAGLGLCLGIGPAVWPWQPAWSQPARGLQDKMLRALGLCSLLASFVFVGLLALGDQLKPYWRQRGFSSILTNPSGKSVDKGFILEEYHQCDFRPVQIALGPDGCLYATGYRGAALQNGVVVKLVENPETGAITEVKVANNLNKPHGLAFHEGNLYVSRSGQYTRAESGSLIETDTGTVTLLRDIDGDGIMDYFHDVLTGLPGAQGPDRLHQNNGIAFGPDGYLYTTVGAHADRAPTLGEFEGTIVRSRPDGSERSVFARGLRNPFDLTFGPDGALFCTDNDASEARAGDELNHVVEGGHYGFPYADGVTDHPAGTIGPILVNRNGTFQGLVYATSSRLPEKLRNCLYVVSYGSGVISRLQLTREGETYRVESQEFAQVPDALDITADDEGNFYVCCFESSKIFRLRYRGEGK